MDLFEKPVQSGSAQAVVFETSSIYDETLPKNVYECLFDLTDKGSYLDFWVMHFS